MWCNYSRHKTTHQTFSLIHLWSTRQCLLSVESRRKTGRCKMFWIKTRIASRIMKSTKSIGTKICRLRWHPEIDSMTKVCAQTIWSTSFSRNHLSETWLFLIESTWLSRRSETVSSLKPQCPNLMTKVCPGCVLWGNLTRIWPMTGLKTWRSRRNKKLMTELPWKMTVWIEVNNMIVTDHSQIYPSFQTSGIWKASQS